MENTCAKKVDISKLAYQYWAYKHNKNTIELTENEKSLACKELKEIWKKNGPMYL